MPTSQAGSGPLHFAFGRRIASHSPEEERRRCSELQAEIKASRLETQVQHQECDEMRHIANVGRQTLEVAEQLRESASSLLNVSRDQLRNAWHHRNFTVRDRQETELTEESLSAGYRRLEAEASELEVEVAEAWQHSDRLRRSEMVKQSQLQELEARIKQCSQERLQLQTECSSLQQECEGAQTDLHEAEALLRSGDASVQLMAQQKLQLEWAIQHRVQQQAILQQAHSQKGYQLANIVATDQRQQELLLAAARKQFDRIREDTSKHKFVARVVNQEAVSCSQEHACLEHAVSENLNRMELLGEQIQELFAGAAIEEDSRLAAAEATQRAIIARRSLEDKVASLQKYGGDVADRRRLALSTMRRRATEVLEWQSDGQGVVPDPWVSEQCKKVVAVVPPDSVLFQLSEAAFPAMMSCHGGVRARIEALARRHSQKESLVSLGGASPQASPGPFPATEMLWPPCAAGAAHLSHPAIDRIGRNVRAPTAKTADTRRLPS